MATSRDISKISPQARKSFGIKDGVTTATGFEKVVMVAGQGITRAQFALSDTFYGKYEQRVSGSVFQKALDKGLVNVLEEICSIDLCQILNYAINAIPGSKAFDPKSDPPKEPLAASKYFIQKTAYDLQLKIDGFHSQYTDTSSNESKLKGVYTTINEIKESFKEINDPNAQSALKDPKLLQAFPQMNAVNTFIEKIFADTNKYTDYRQIPITELQKLLLIIDRTRNYTILIQGLNSPAALLNFTDTAFPNANIQEQIQRLQKIINPARLMPLLRNIIESIKKVQSICNVFLSFISFAQAIISICLTLIKVFNIIIKFLEALPIPNQFTILGLTIKFGNASQKLKKFLDQASERLSQINTLLSYVSAIISQVIFILKDIIANINLILINLESCNNADPLVIQDLKDTRDNLEKTVEQFEKFLKNYENNKKNQENSFGNYNIQIITEEVVDDAIRLRRRYGIALDKNKNIVATSTPTFASDNQIIVNEVKVILISNKLVVTPYASLDASQMSTIDEAFNYLYDSKIDIENIDLDNFDNNLDSGINEDENDGLGLNAFMNKLQGGKKLRENMRKMMKKNSEQLKSDLSATK